MKKKYVLYYTGFISALLFCLDLHAQTAQSHLEDGIAKNDRGVYAEAIADFSKALDINAYLEEAYYQRGLSYWYLGLYREALADFSKAIDLDPKESMNYYKRGQIYEALGEQNLAIQDYSQSIRMSPNFELPYTDRADLYRKQKKYSRALRDCDEALRLNPTYARVLSIRGLIKMDQGQSAESYADLKRAVQIAPREAELRSNLADYYRKNHENEKAVEEYSAAINLSPNNAQTYCRRASLKLSLGNNTDALKDANRAIYNDRRYWPAYIIRGIAYYNLDQKQKSEQDINRYLSQARRAEDYYELSSQILEYAEEKPLQIQGNEILEKAEGWAQKAIQLQDSYENNLLLAHILFKLNRTTLARSVAQRAKDIARSFKEDASEVELLISKIDREYADNTPPVIAITSPLAKARGVIVVEAANKITVIGQAQDESGVVRVLINGNPARLKPDGHFDGETMLTGESNLITVRAYDTRGNEAQERFTVKRQPAVAAVAPPPASNAMGRQIALLFATNQYDEWGPLINPIYDARAIAQDLRDLYGFEVDLQENLKKDAVMLKIKEYARKQYNSNDQLFIFFAGHGQFDEIFKEGYVVARDSRFEEDSKSSYISHSNLKTYINSIPCKHILLVMDVCFGGTFDRTLAMRGAQSNITSDRQELINRKLRYSTRRYLTSGGKEYVPDGRPGQHSPFARMLLEALRSEGGMDRILTLPELLAYVSQAQPKPHSGEFGTNEPGSDFLFIAR